MGHVSWVVNVFQKAEQEEEKPQEEEKNPKKEKKTLKKTKKALKKRKNPQKGNFQVQKRPKPSAISKDIPIGPPNLLCFF